MNKKMVIMVMVAGAFVLTARATSPTCPSETEALTKRGEQLMKDVQAFAASAKIKQSELKAESEILSVTSKAIQDKLKSVQDYSKEFNARAQELQTLGTLVKDISDATSATTKIIADAKASGTVSNEASQLALKYKDLIANKTKALTEAWTKYITTHPEATTVITEVKKIQADVVRLNGAVTKASNDLTAFVQNNALTKTTLTGLSLTDGIKKLSEAIQAAAKQFKQKVTEFKASAEDQTKKFKERGETLKSDGEKLGEKCNPMATGTELYKNVTESFSKLFEGDFGGFGQGMLVSAENVIQMPWAGVSMGLSLINLGFGKLMDLAGVDMDIPGFDLANAPIGIMSDFTGNIMGSLKSFSTGDWQAGLLGLGETAQDLSVGILNTPGAIGGEVDNIFGAFGLDPNVESYMNVGDFTVDIGNFAVDTFKSKLGI